MTKAQEVRSRRLEEQDMTADVEKIFDWILRLADLNTRDEDFQPLELLSFYHEKDPKISLLPRDQYPLRELYSSKKNKEKLFQKLKERIDKEEGYRTYLESDCTFYGVASIKLTIVIE